MLTLLLVASACTPTAVAPPADPTSAGWDAPPGPVAPPPPALGTNILLLVADDIGADQISAYQVHPDQPPTPTLSRLAAQGVKFDRAYAYPTCSPARAALLTGRTPLTHGMGAWIDPPEESFDLPLDEVTIPEMLDQGTAFAYTSALFGKWHLATHGYAAPAFHALDQGFDWHQGSFENLGGSILRDPHNNNYTHWEKVTNGELAWVDEYATTVTVDDALAKIPKLPEPWFVVVAFNAPHVPIHLPPAHLHTQTVTDCSLDPLGCTNAMVEAMDTELDRLLRGLGPALLQRTTTVFTSDNGTATQAIAPPFDPLRSKGSLMDGGVRVPLIVTGPYVLSPGVTSSAFINFVDLFPTIAEIADVDLTQVRPVPGADPVDIDGQSFLHLLRDGAGSTLPYAFSFQHRKNGPPPRVSESLMVRDDDYKLIRSLDSPDKLFRYDPANVDEGPDLVELGTLSSTDQAALDDLGALLDTLVASMPYEGP